MLLEMPNITVNRCDILNPATFLPMDEDGEDHNCVAVLDEVCSLLTCLKYHCLTLVLFYLQLVQHLACTLPLGEIKSVMQ